MYSPPLDLHLILGTAQPYSSVWRGPNIHKCRIAGKFGGEFKFGGLAVFLTTAKLKFLTRIYTYGDPVPNHQFLQ